MENYTDNGLAEIAGAFSEVLKNNYEKGYSDGKEASEKYIQVLKRDIDNCLSREILLRNEITKLRNQIKRG